MTSSILIIKRNGQNLVFIYMTFLQGFVITTSNSDTHKRLPLATQLNTKQHGDFMADRGHRRQEDDYNIRWQLMISGMVTEYSQTMTAQIKIKLHHRHGTVDLLPNTMPCLQMRSTLNFDILHRAAIVRYDQFNSSFKKTAKAFFFSEILTCPAITPRSFSKTLAFIVGDEVVVTIGPFRVSYELAAEHLTQLD